MSTTASGREAEELAAQQLRSSGHTIVEKNWRTRWCEIDIVSKLKGTVYFTEVKYRSSEKWGSGFDYITPKKQQQMAFAAEFWMSQYQWSGDACLLAAEVTHDGKVRLVSIDL